MISTEPLWVHYYCTIPHLKNIISEFTQVLTIQKRRTRRFFSLTFLLFLNCSDTKTLYFYKKNHLIKDIQSLVIMSVLNAVAYFLLKVPK